MSPLKTLVFAAAFVALPVGLVRADTIWISTTNSSANAIKADGVKITVIKGDRLYYTTDAGMQASKPLTQLPQINLDGATSFNSAENAYAANDYDTAITNYQSVLQDTSAKDWMQSRAAERLITAAKAKNRFDAEVSAYCSLLLKDATAAAANKPAVPPEHSQYLDAALTTVSKTLENPQLTPTQKSALLGLELEIDRAKGDKAQTSATLQQLVALGSASPADVAMLKVESANVDLDSKQYTQAINTIDQNRALFTEPDQQVEALYVLAQAHMGLDGDKTDPDKLKDLALNYMRVVTFGNRLPDRPHVADSLLQAAQIEEKLGDKQAATALYQQLVRDRAYAGTPEAAKAQQALGMPAGASGSAPFGLPGKK